MAALLRHHSFRVSFALALSLAAAFATRWTYLRLGFYGPSPDDFDWIKLKLSIGMVEKVIDPQKIGWFYRPVFLIWMMLFHQFAPYNSTAMHAGSLVLFGLTVFGVGMLVARIMRSGLAGVLAAVIFLTAPAMEEAIWWISSTSTLLAAVFSLAACHCLIGWRETRRHIYAVLMFISMALALGSKEDAATLPLILIALDVFLAYRDGVFSRGRRAAWRRLGSSAAAFLAGMGGYGFLDITAYRHATASGGGTMNLWHGVTPDVLRKTASFGIHTLFFDHLSNPIAFRMDSTVVFAMLVVLVLASFWRSPLVIFALASGLLGFSPVPIATGPHVFSGRFWYLPNLYGVILCVAIIVQTLRSERLEIRLVGAALLTDVVLRHASSLADLLHAPQLPFDPLTLWIVEMGVMLAALVCWRLKSHFGRFALLTAAGAFATLVLPMTDLESYVTPIFVLLGSVYGASLRDRRAIPMGAALGAALSLASPWSLLIVLSIACRPSVRRDTTASNTG